MVGYPISWFQQTPHDKAWTAFSVLASSERSSVTSARLKFQKAHLRPQRLTEVGASSHHVDTLYGSNADKTPLGVALLPGYINPVSCQSKGVVRNAAGRQLILPNNSLPSYSFSFLPVGSLFNRRLSSFRSS